MNRKKMIFFLEFSALSIIRKHNHMKINPELSTAYSKNCFCFSIIIEISDFKQIRLLLLILKSTLWTHVSKLTRCESNETKRHEIICNKKINTIHTFLFTAFVLSVCIILQIKAYTIAVAFKQSHKRRLRRRTDIQF